MVRPTDERAVVAMQPMPRERSTMSTDERRIRQAPVVLIEEPGRQPLALAILLPTEIGRECDGIVLTDHSISRRHLLVTPDGHTVRVTDLGTTNGSRCGGTPIEHQHLLAVDDVIEFGQCTLRIAAVGEPDQVREPLRDTGAQAPPDLRATSIDLVAAAAMAEPIPPPVEPDVGTVTLVFSDIENSTTRAVELGDAQWIHVIATHNNIVRRMVARHGGTEVKAQGDGFMLRFRSARTAIACMVDVQQALAAHATAEPLTAVRVRAGIHTGEVIVGDDGDIYGRHVIFAARISDQARGGEVLVSSLVREIVEPRGDVHFTDSRTVTLKGLSGTHLVHSIRW
jgi:class 3 adenylate cyclase